MGNPFDGNQPHRQFQFLPDYKVWNIGDVVAFSVFKIDLTQKDAWKNFRWFRILNRHMIARDNRAVALANLPAAAANRNLDNDANWTRWLEASNKTFVSWLIGFITNQYCEWDVRLPSSNLVGGTQGTPLNRWTQDDSSYWNPRLNLYSFNDGQNDSFYPIFTIYNRSQYALSLAKIAVIGWKYDIAEIDTSNMNEEPRFKDYVVLSDVNVR